MTTECLKENYIQTEYQVGSKNSHCQIFEFRSQTTLQGKILIRISHYGEIPLKILTLYDHSATAVIRME